MANTFTCSRRGVLHPGAAVEVDRGRSSRQRVGDLLVFRDPDDDVAAEVDVRLGLQRRVHRALDRGGVAEHAGREGRCRHHPDHGGPVAGDAANGQEQGAGPVTADRRAAGRARGTRTRATTATMVVRNSTGNIRPTTSIRLTFAPRLTGTPHSSSRGNGHRRRQPQGHLPGNEAEPGAPACPTWPARDADGRPPTRPPGPRGAGRRAPTHRARPTAAGSSVGDGPTPTTSP